MNPNVTSLFTMPLQAFKPYSLRHVSYLQATDLEYSTPMHLPSMLLKRAPLTVLTN